MLIIFAKNVYISQLTTTEFLYKASDNILNYNV